MSFWFSIILLELEIKKIVIINYYQNFLTYARNDAKCFDIFIFFLNYIKPLLFYLWASI